MKIGSFEIGTGRTFVVAEIGVNHNGSVNFARQLIAAAAWAGADAVKFQTFRSEELGAPGLAPYELPPDAWPVLADAAQALGLIFFSTPFDCGSVDLLDPLVPCFKIASGEITNEKLLRHVASKGKPIMLSTGMADLPEIYRAMQRLLPQWPILLHCVSAYPAPVADMDLNVIARWREESLEARRATTSFTAWAIGLSDHSLGTTIPIAAVALGAAVIEKHFTLSRSMKGLDCHMSADPATFQSMVEAIRTVEAALGDGIKRCQSSEEETRRRARRDPKTGRRPA